MSGSVVARCGVIMIVLLSCDRRAVAEQPALTMTMRIYDYSNAPVAQLEAAQSYVMRVYEPVGVRFAWLVPYRPRCPFTGGTVADISIAVITERMAMAAHVPDAVVAYAAVARGRRGRIAYVIADRVERIAAAARTATADVLGIVIAHEIGHLLMPFDAHTPSGVMRPRWKTADFRRADARRLRFTPDEAAAIRRTLRQDLPAMSTSSDGATSATLSADAAVVR